MITTRRDVLISGLAAVAAGAISAGLGGDGKKTTSYFAGTAVDNGVTYQTTNFAKIDKKWHKQVVKYFSERAARHGRRRYEPPLPLPDHGEQDGDPLRRRRRPRRLQMVRPRHDRPQVAVAEMDAAAGDAQAPSRNCRPSSRAARRRTRSARAPCICIRDGVDIGYRLHGTLEPWSIGTDASSGCIRMFTEDVIDLYQRCPIGTAVQVLPHIADQADKSKPQADPTIVE